MCLDVLKASSREPDAALAVLRTLADASHGLPGADEAVAFIGTTFRRVDGKRVARLGWKSRLCLLQLPNKVSPRHAGLFAETRLAGNHATMYGAVDLSEGDMRALLERLALNKPFLYQTPTRRSRSLCN